MEEVARAAQISRPGLYFLFESKEVLFRTARSNRLQVAVEPLVPGVAAG